ncbi:MAG: DUF4286 family protein [Parafilimonas sp.]
MFIYNVTTKVNWSIHDAWLEWMQQEHIPALIETNCFVRSQLLKLHEQDDEEGPTYVIQYFAESKALYNRYIELYADQLRKEYAGKWRDNFIAFRTLLEVVE